MGKWLRIALTIAIVVGLFPALPGQSGAAGTTSAVIVDPGSVISDNLVGLGFEWDPTDGYDFTDEQWQMNFERIDYTKAPFIRLMLWASLYTVDLVNDKPVYDWNTPEMQRIYKILDYCQSRGVTVMIGEWNKPHRPPLNISASDDPIWAKMIADFLDYMINVRGYTVLKYYNYINEPNGTWGGAAIEEGNRFGIWKNGIMNLSRELNSRPALKGKIQIVGPDSSGEDIWVDYTVNAIPDLIGMYDIHRYATDDYVLSGELEKMVRSKRGYIDKYDPKGPSKPFVMGEAGLVTGKIEALDQQPRVHDFDYGVMMADFAVQNLRGGMSGFLAWMLDDAMHFAPNTTPDQNILKVWGFWNTMGDEQDRQIRPWFYPMSLLSRYFPAGSSIVYAGDTGNKDVRVTAAVKDNKHVTVAIVNQSDSPQTIKLIVPGVSFVPKLTQYRYFDEERPTNEQGFPVAAQTKWGVDLSQAYNVYLPGQGVVLLTSMDGSAATIDTRTNLALHKPVTASSSEFSSLRQPSEATDGQRATYWQSKRTNNQWLQVDLGKSQTINRVKIRWDEGYGRKFTIQLSEDGQIWRTAYTRMSGTGVADDIEFAPQTARYVRVAGTKAGTELGYSIQELEVYYVPNASVTSPETKQTYIDDPLDDWRLIASKSGGWSLDRDNDFFDGDPSRAKRETVGTEYMIYELDDITKFTMQLYYSEEVNDRFKVYGSPDGQAWTILPTVGTDTHNTKDGWEGTLYSNAADLPTGTNYLKIEFNGGNFSWSPELAWVKINDAPTVSAEVRLAQLSVDGIPLPDFSPDQLDYTVTLSPTTTWIPEVTAKAVSEEAVLEVTNPATVPGTATIVVKFGDQSQQTYTVRFVKEAAADLLIDDLDDLQKLFSKSDGMTLDSGNAQTFNGDNSRIKRWENHDEEIVYRLDSIRNFQSVLYAQNNVAVHDAVYAYTSMDGTNWTASPIGISEGTTTAGAADWFEHQLQSQPSLPAGTQYLKLQLKKVEPGGQGWTPQIGQVTLNDQELLNAALSDLQVNGTTVAGFSSDQPDYRIVLPAGTTAVPVVTATPSISDATVAILQADGLPGTALVVVTAKDGSTRPYYIRFAVPVSTDATLTELSVNGVPIADFSPETTNYLVELPYGTTAVPVLQATASDPKARTAITLPAVVPGIAQVTVKAEDPTVTQMYSVHFKEADLTAALVASWIASVERPVKDAVKLALPEVPDGFSIAIQATDNEKVISKDGSIAPPSSDTTVRLVYEVTKEADGSQAVTGVVAVIVPAKSGSNTGGNTGSVSGGGGAPMVAPADLDIKDGMATLQIEEGKNSIAIPVSELTRISKLEVKNGLAAMVVNKAVWEQLLAKAGQAVRGSLVIVLSESKGESDVKSGEPSVTMKAAGPVYDAAVILQMSDGTELAVDPAAGEIKLTLPYRAADVNPQLLGIYYWNESTDRLEYAGGSVDLALGQMTAELTHMGKIRVLEWNKIYSDLPVKHWAYETVRILSARHAVNGVTTTTFDPSKAATRAEFTTMIVRALGLQASTNTSPFTDVSANAWYASGVQAAMDAGIVTGDGSKRFNPDGAITRAEIAVILSRALGLQTLQQETSSFADDSAIPAWAKQHVAAARHEGLLNGKGANMFDPMAKATRAETAVLMLKVMSR